MLQRLGIALTHVSDFDTNGYMHCKGTQGNTHAYQNPQGYMHYKGTQGNTQAYQNF